jgi:formylglycine-generating enzyme required for sulfatase activity
MSPSASRQTAFETGAASLRFLLTHRSRSQGFREPLVEPISNEAASTPILTMLWIPPGRFWMGSPAEEAERRETEEPQHLVQVPGFFLAQTPITQAQWRAVAEWMPLKGEEATIAKLNPAPSYFKGDKHPVEGVSWHDAMEFCRRLSQHTGRHYTLPSEAQWEYACRAGTTKPFHFGETISSELANYDSTVIYGAGSKGEYRRQTTDVGTFPANAWGLYDMHGNVHEWCADYWHPNYDGAPKDGRPWIDENVEEDEMRVMRGGSWSYLPRRCRSASRDLFESGMSGPNRGFRVCCLSQIGRVSFHK